MSDLAAKYKIPPELNRFFDAGFLEFLSEDDAQKTVKFDIPSINWTDDNDRDTTFTLVWIHPDFNEQFCQSYNSKPGDLANFYVFKESADLGDDWLDVDTLVVVRLVERQEIRSRRKNDSNCPALTIASAVRSCTVFVKTTAERDEVLVDTGPVIRKQA